MRLGVELRLHRVRDHHVALAFGDETGDFGVFLMGRHLRLGEVLIDVEFVRAARVLDDAHVGPVETFVRREAVRLRSVHERHLSEGDVARQKGAELETRHRGRDPAHRDVEFVGLEVGREFGPGRVDVLDLPARGPGHGFKELHVVTDVAPVFLHGEGTIITRRSDAQGFHFFNSIKSFARRCADTKGRAERRGDENIAYPHDSLRKVS